MRNVKEVGEITLKNGEMLTITLEEYTKIMQSKAKSSMGDVYIQSMKRMIQKPYIVDMKTKWIDDPQQKMLESTKREKIAEQNFVISDGKGPGYQKFLEAKKRFLRRTGKIDGTQNNNTRSDA